MKIKLELALGMALCIVGGLFISFGAGVSWGLTGAFIAGGAYIALFGVVLVMEAT